MIVLKLDYAGKSAILAGDAQWDSWAKMTEEFPHFEKTGNPDQRIQLTGTVLPLRCAFLKVAHHGSKHGTALEAVERLKPKYSILSCAEDSRHKFPHALATGALEDVETEILSTRTGSHVFWVNQAGAMGHEDYGEARAAVPPAPLRS